MPSSSVSDSASSLDTELRDHVERTLAATYEVERELGRGGMGVVYRARDKRLKRHVAIKLLPPELAFRRDVRQRFLREAETAAQLSHPNIVPIYSVDEIDNLVFFVMACVDGDNLAVQLLTRGPLPIEEVRRYLTEVADALAYAHGRGVIHRDIKPDNILVDAVDGRAMVTDFGIARAVEGGDASRLTATGMAIGTPAYMSPEQASGEREVDGRSDLYALGIVAYQMLTGSPPFTGNTTPVLLVKHLSEMPVPVEERRPDTPPILAAIVMRLLEKDPAHRFQDAGELTQALRSGVVANGSRGSANAGGASVRPAWTSPNSAPAPARDWQGRPVDEPRGLAGTYGTATGRGPVARGSTGTADAAAPTADDMARWEASPVQAFRKKLAPYLFVNGAIVLVSIVSNSNATPITVIWSIYLAYQYAKLWADGFDWRDVLRQPRDRMLGDVLSDVGESIEATFNKKKRDELRAQGRTAGPLSGALSPRAPVRAVAAGPADPATLGAYAAAVSKARSDRDDITRMHGLLPAADRTKIADVVPTAVSLADKIEQLAKSLLATEEALAESDMASIDAEIASLEAAANPLEAGSDARVRRLASLRRERRAVIDLQSRHEAGERKLEACRLALENMRLDLVRLRAGNSTVQNVTLIAEQAMDLARDVDHVVAAALEVRELTTPRGARG